MTTPALLLLLSLFFCHFLADFTHLSTKWMLDAKRLGKPLFPILCHALVHATLMGIVIHIYLWQTNRINPFAFEFDINDKLFLFQWTTHFLIDVWKGRMNGWFPLLQDQSNKWHWVVFGFDQFLHITVIVIMVYWVNNLI
jgi:hypothetical protein